MKRFIILLALSAVGWSEPKVQIFTLSNRPAAATVDIVKAVLDPTDQVFTDERLQRLIVKADPERLEKVRQLLEQIDVPAPQVWLKVAQNANLQQSRTSLLQTGSVSQDVSGTQTLLVMSGERGEIVVGQDIPFVQPFWNYASGLGLIAPSLVFQSVSTGFAVEPTVVGDRVRLRIYPWMSYQSAGGRGRIDFSEAATSVTLANGQVTTISSNSGSESRQQSAFGLILGFGDSQRATSNSIQVSAEIKPE